MVRISRRTEVEAAGFTEKAQGVKDAPCLLTPMRRIAPSAKALAEQGCYVRLGRKGEVGGV